MSGAIHVRVFTRLHRMQLLLSTGRLCGPILSQGRQYTADSRPRLCSSLSFRYAPVLIPNRTFRSSPFHSVTTKLKERNEIDAFLSKDKDGIHNANLRKKTAKGEEILEGAETGRSGREGEERKFDMWKVKQKRFTRHITNLVRKGKVEEAEQVFQDMLSGKVRPDTAAFNNLIAGWSRVGDADKAFKLFNNLKKRGLLPTDPTYTSLFRACTEMGPSSLPLLEKIISEIDRRGTLLNTIASNSLIVAMATCGMLDEAFQVYLDMSKRRQQPDVSTFTALLSACARDKESGMERVMHVWQEMSACGITPDLMCYNTLLQCVREAGIPEDMKQLVDEEVTVPEISVRELHAALTHTAERNRKKASTLKQKATAKTLLKSSPFTARSRKQLALKFPGSPDVAMTIHLTNSGWRWLDSGSVEGFLRAVKDGGLDPDIHTLYLLSLMAVDWTAVLREVGVVERGVAKDAEVGGARRAVLDDKCVLAAARLQSQLGNGDGAEVLRVFGEEVGLSLGGAGYQAVAVSCLSLRQGLLLLARMKEAEVSPGQHIIGTLLSNAASRRDYEYLVTIMKEMRHSKIPPNKIIAQILKKVASGKISQSPRMKLRYNGFKGYYTIWKRHYPELQ